MKIHEILVKQSRKGKTYKTEYKIAHDDACGPANEQTNERMDHRLWISDGRIGKWSGYFAWRLELTVKRTLITRTLSSECMQRDD